MPEIQSDQTFNALLNLSACMHNKSFCCFESFYILIMKYFATLFFCYEWILSSIVLRVTPT